MEQESGMSRGFVRVAVIGLMVAASMLAQAADQHAHGMQAEDAAPASFVASTAKSFDALMKDAMTVMDRDMRAAPANTATKPMPASMAKGSCSMGARALPKVAPM